MRNRAKTVAFLGLCTALALVLAYAESLIPPLYPSLPGIKMGLPNIIVIFLLYKRNAKAAIAVSLLRMVLVAVLFGNGMMLLYSLAGGGFSMLAMILLEKTDWLSVVGVSIAGGVMHNAGQILMAMLLLDTTELGYYLVVLTVTGILAGIFVGLCSAALIRKIPA
jgi:heptaprenyl diphosphate synthase